MNFRRASLQTDIALASQQKIWAVDIERSDDDDLFENSESYVFYYPVIRIIEKSFLR